MRNYRDDSYYHGTPKQGVFFNGKRLPMSKEGGLSSPTGFNWGYAGSGPYALSHSILAHLCSKDIADEFAIKFKFEVIAELENGQPFKLEVGVVRRWVYDALKKSISIHTEGNGQYPY